MKIYNPTSISQAIDLLQEHRNEIRLLAGGTDFVVKYKEGSLDGKAVCNIHGINELRCITESNNYLIIGPLTTHEEIVESSLVNQYAPLLAEACATVGSPQIRNRGTLGGNIGTASPAGDALPPLVVLGAELKIVSAESEKIVSMRDFFSGPGKTILKPNEMITEIIVPKMKAGEKGFYTKLGTRNSLAISIVGVAAKVKVHENVIEKMEVALGSVGPTVIYKRMQDLEGQTLTTKALWDKVQMIKNEISPITDLRATADYRKEMSAALLFQGLNKFV